MSLVVKTVPTEITLDKAYYIDRIMKRNCISNFSIIVTSKSQYAIVQLYDRDEIKIFESKKLETKLRF